MFGEHYAVGDTIVLGDMAAAPEGCWVVKETRQFLRHIQNGSSVLSITPIAGQKLPADYLPDHFTLIYAGSATSEKASAVTGVLNRL